MRLEELVTPGILPSGQSLRTHAVKAINFLAVVSDYTGSTEHADQLQTFFTACAAEAAKYKRVATTSVTVAPATSTGARGTQVQLTPTVLPAGATGKRVAWTSANPAIAEVDDRGLVTRVGVGVVVITATSTDDSTKSANSTITVT